MSLKDKIVFITGASSGIGKACAFDFAKEGAKLILTARRDERLHQLKEQIQKEFSTDIITLKLDVRDYHQVKKAVSSLPEEWKKIDILINNAGLARGLSKIHEGDVSNWDEMIDTNFKGLIYVTREIASLMAERESGHIINIGSTAGHEVYPNGNVYAATKFAVKAITKSTRLDLLDKKIKVSTVDPGMVETEFSLVRFKGDEERAKKVYEGLKPLEPKDVSSAVIFCAAQPPHVNINEIILTPLAQASSTQVIRE